MPEEEINELKGQPCPMCGKKKLTLTEQEKDVPYFGKVYLFSMRCEECKYYKADIEVAEKHAASKFTLDVSSEDDLKIRVVKSSTATVKIPHITTIEPGPSSNGYVTNVEGILNRVKATIETMRDTDDDPVVKKKAKNLLKKINKVLWAQDSVKIIITDPEGNSAIISDKAKKS
ncbi:ZPR1 zinc finger domain-containing protein [Candidatus Woesearchaeota archaeon]|nr:ZPR1 zinc finger domain-containing protein [Candidatus Woesearchaeota archaeon]MBW3021884.1 ZPR1 zinc finger domain-containing protein [Candidatus Woesearchaeota archaeon]